MRGKMMTRFDPRNVNAECTGCNNSHYSKYELKDMALYAENVDIKWGAGTAAELYRLSKQTKQWEIKELEQLVAAAKMGCPVYKHLYEEIIAKV